MNTNENGNQIVAFDPDDNTVKQTKSTASSVIAHTSSTTLITLLSANSNRLGAIIFNDSAASHLYIKLGASVSLTSFSVKLGPGAYYEIPCCYSGVVTGVCESASGTIRVTELT
ncbi:MAG TPA: hypothetical protein VI423_00850 [Paenisporosarcina sp.]|nr:hypothetical protein [Paenisporosarcina sp.]